ncbi:MAG: peptidylprolyl isomerase [Bacillota bacterium]
MKKVFAIFLVVVMIFSMTACGESAEEQSYDNDDYGGTNPIVTIEMENGGIITIELYPDVAPATVANFVSLVEEGFYDGLIFHRCIEGFMIQGGDPLGTGTGGSDEKIVGEFSANGYENNLSHTRGVISMARSSSYDSASSQFFIMHQDYTGLDGSYAAFGMVIDGMDVVDEIVSVEKTVGSDGAYSSPIEQQIMKSVTVSYGE